MNEVGETRIIEVKEKLLDSDLISNIYQVKHLFLEIEREISFLVSINTTDYNYLNILMLKMKQNLKKVHSILKLQD